MVVLFKLILRVDLCHEFALVEVEPLFRVQADFISVVLQHLDLFVGRFDSG